MTRREACFVILAVALGSVSALHCPKNPACTCQPNTEEGIEINCAMKNNSFFIVNIEPNQYIKIQCINSPDWSDFYLDMPSLTENVVNFYLCELPTNRSLGEIARMLGAANVEKLIFQSYKNLSSALIKHHLDDFENLKTLTLSSNNVSYVDKDLLSGLVNLTGLNLYDNNLHSVDEFFNYTPGLQWLELGNNALQSIELGTFDNLKNLTLLNLWKNHLVEPQSGIFDEIVALKTLDLNTNNMVKLPEDIFAKLENLEVLNLSRNNFTHLPGNLLRNNTKLKSVSLFNNKRNMTLPNEFFANLTELQVLQLKKIGLVTLPKDLFRGCISITNITLERNYLQTLPVEIFRDLKELLELKLNFNDLEKLPDHIFANNKQLAKLDLSKNRMTSISKHLFDGLSALKELNMEKNKLMTISDHAFSSLKKLKIIRMSNNYLTLKDTLYEYSDPYGKQSPFRNCESLEELYLANNNISEIFIDWTLVDLQLRKLDLKYNNITNITSDDVQFLSSEIEVDLTHNKIQHIFILNVEPFGNYQEDPRSNTKLKRKILVDYNPLHCDCWLYNFLRYLEVKMSSQYQKSFHIIPGNLTCESPPEMKNMRVKDFRSKTLTCRVTNPDVCSEKCVCLLRPDDKAFIFNCSQKNLSGVPSDVKKPNDFFQFELNFSGNRLTRMPDLKAMGFVSGLKKLNLSHNYIDEMSLDGLSNTIEVLELHDNKISRIPSDVLEFLKESNLTSLTLHDNPWECDCYAKDFGSFIRNKFGTMLELREVKCLETNTFVFEMTDVDFCPVYTALIIGISVSLCLTGLLISVLGLLYYKYQRQIKVWLYAHQWCLWCVTEEELDKEKLYDAFVSYSHKDHDFVVNELVSKLESDPMPFKLCLHYRDFVPGEWITKNIASSVENSKRTVVVLTPNFLESVWGKMEFRAAHSQALSDGRARVILILHGDIGPTDDLDPELKAYLDMNTYVKWGDPWFWDKLRYALPHKLKHARNSNVGKVFENQRPCIQVNGDKKELIYPVDLPDNETPSSTTPPADTIKKFICDKESEKQLFLNGYPRKSCKLDKDIAIILSPEHLMKNENGECLV